MGKGLDRAMGTAVNTAMDDDTVTGAGVEVTHTAGLPRAAVWSLVTEVQRIGERSPECFWADWLDRSAPGPWVGARFEARNRYPDGATASVVCVVTEAVHPSTFAWAVLDDEGDPARPASLWRHDLLPADAPQRTVVRHGFVHGPGNSGAREAARRDPASLARRLEQLSGNMAAALTAMARCGGGGEAVLGTAG